MKNHLNMKTIMIHIYIFHKYYIVFLMIQIYIISIIPQLKISKSTANSY